MRILFILILVFPFYKSVNGQILFECISPSDQAKTYLLGTCHILPKEGFRFDPKIDSVINLSEVIFSEYLGDLKEISISDYKGYIYYENGKSLSDFVPPKDLKFIYSFYSKNFHITRNRFKSLKYFLPYSMHQRIVYTENQYIKIDKLLYSKAIIQNKKIIQLDNKYLLSQAYNELNEIYNLQWLTTILHNFEREKTEKKLLFNAYLNQDTTQLKIIMQSDLTASNDVIIKERNNHWIKLIEENAKNTNFIFAGIAHILEENHGLLNYFRSNGYTIRSISLDITK
jgi:uncharacterized protein YbaP (TraB family)